MIIKARSQGSLASRAKPATRTHVTCCRRLLDRPGKPGRSLSLRSPPSTTARTSARQNTCGRACCVPHNQRPLACSPAGQRGLARLLDLTGSASTRTPRCPGMGLAQARPLARFARTRTSREDQDARSPAVVTFGVLSCAKMSVVLTSAKTLGPPLGRGFSVVLPAWFFSRSLALDLGIPRQPECTGHPNRNGRSASMPTVRPDGRTGEVREDADGHPCPRSVRQGGWGAPCKRLAVRRLAHGVGKLRIPDSRSTEPRGPGDVPPIPPGGGGVFAGQQTVIRNGLLLGSHAAAMPTGIVDRTIPVPDVCVFATPAGEHQGRPGRTPPVPPLPPRWGGGNSFKTGSGKHASVQGIPGPSRAIRPIQTGSGITHHRHPPMLVSGAVGG